MCNGAINRCASNNFVFFPIGIEFVDNPNSVAKEEKWQQR